LSTETSNEGLKRGFKIVVPAADIDTQCATRLKEVASTATLPGFRKGKVPVNLLKKRFGQSVRGEVLEKTVDESTRKTMEERDLKPAAQPKIEVVSFDEGKDLEYTVDLEVLPEITATDFSELSIEQLSVKIGDSELDDALKGLAERQKTSEPVAENRESKSGDIVVIDFKGEVDGKGSDSLNGDDFNLELGSNMFIPGFEDQVIGMKGGDNKTVEVTFPADYGSAEMAGKDAKFDVTVKEVREAKLPEMDDKFAEALGQESFAALKDAMRDDMGKQFEETTRSIMKRKLLDVLDEKHDFPLPEVMVDQEFSAIWQQIESDKAAGNLEGDDAEKSEDDLKAEYRKIAERRVKLGLLLSEVGNKNEIEITEQDLTQAVIKEARKYPGQEQQVFEFFTKNRDAQISLRAPILEDKVVDFIVALAKTSKTEVSVEDLGKMVEEMEKEDA